MNTAEPLIFVYGIRRIVCLARCEHSLDPELVVNAVVRADAQTLSEAVSRTVSVVACRRFVRLCLLRLAHLRAIVATMGARAHPIVAEEVEAALRPVVRCRCGAAQEEALAVEILERHTVLIDKHTIFVSMNACTEERAELIELHIHAKAEHAVVVSAVVVLMAEEIIDSRVDGEVLANVLLDEEVPDAEALFAILAALTDIVAVLVLREL